ncbi:MAG: type II toxin-antitoxin system VapC family toxin [Chloroflexota bacterium]|nr:type II toxin-antitoxin system VapC family toxin [Chloroflexota bacterium]
MGWVDALRGQVVGLDTMPLIYWIEEHPTYLAIVLPFFEALERGEVQVLTSTVTIIEVLVNPIRRNDLDLAQRYRDRLFATRWLTTVPLSPAIAEEAAKLRAMYNLRTPDAVQLATAISEGTAAFLTNDVRLPRLSRPRVLVLDELRTQA